MMGARFRLFDIKPAYLTCMVTFEGVVFPLPSVAVDSCGRRLTSLTAGSILCATTMISSVIVLGWALAGFGAAGVVQGRNEAHVYFAPLHKRPLNLGLVFNMFGVGVCYSPISGGAFTDIVGLKLCCWM
jgi:MFS family permease